MNTSLEWVMDLTLGILCLALVLSAARIALGPSRADRVIAMDMASYVAIGITAVLALQTNTPILLDVGAVTAVAAFVGTVGLTRYVEARERDVGAPDTAGQEALDEGAARSESSETSGFSLSERRARL
jgi:multicomponent Na+:H+ antiporter subunit F